MAKKRLKIDKDAKRCGECSHGYFEETAQNRAHDGGYILITCPHHQFKHFREDVACTNFKQKQKNL